jgi:hypothetical protein
MLRSVTDIHNFDVQFRNQLDKLEEADIDERDAEAIREFIRFHSSEVPPSDSYGGVDFPPEVRPVG